MSEVSAALELLARETPRRLDGADLVAVARLAEDLTGLRNWLLGHRDDAPAWAAAAAQLADLSTLAGELRRCLDRDGSPARRGQPLLARLRRQQRDRERQVRASVNRAMAEAARRGWTTADEVTLRGDRFCLPLRAGDRRKIGRHRA